MAPALLLVTMGPPIADSALQQAQLLVMLMTPHLYSDRIFAGADTLATAEVLGPESDRSRGEQSRFRVFRAQSFRWRNRPNRTSNCMGSWATFSLAMALIMILICGADW